MTSPALPETRTFTGQAAGPHLLVTAGVHGDEFLPMLAVRELIARFEGGALATASLRGAVTFVTVANPPAFALGRRCGDDGLDLARTCPGRPDGSPTERIAAFLSERIRTADAYLDLHTGGTEMSIFPLAGYTLHPDSEILARQRCMARAFGLPLVWGTAADLNGRTLSVARDAGVPAIYVEYLGAHRERREIAEGAPFAGAEDHPLVAGCWKVMTHLGMLGDPGSAIAEAEVIEDWRSGSGHLQVSHPAPLTGFFEAAASLGDRVETGDLLAIITPSDSGRRVEIRASGSGLIVARHDFPRIRCGSATAVIASSHAAS